MTEQTEKPQIQTTCTATPTLNEQQAILIQRLKEAGLSTKCFLKVGGSFDKKTGEFKPKAPFESDWQHHLYSPSDFDKTCYCIICNGNQPHARWGISAGQGLILLDSDDRRLYNALSNDTSLPKTFEVTSARRKIPTKLYAIDGPTVENLHLFIPEEKKSVGELRADNWQCVAAGTTIPYIDLQTNEEKTGMYVISKNIAIARITYADFMTAITPFLGSDPTQRLTIEEIENGVPEGERATVLFKEACKFAYADVSPQFVFDALKVTAARCNPPFTDESELHRMVENAFQYKGKAQNSQTPNKTELTQTNQAATMQEPITLKEVKDTYEKWLYLEGDGEVIDVVFAAAIDRRVKGDPLWLFLIAASGGTKTEIVRNIKNKDIYTLDSVTAHSFVSGKIDKDADGTPVPVEGILKEIDGKVLILKDFTVLLSKRQEDRDEIFSQFRSLYDGYIEFAFGTSSTPVRIKANIGLIAAVTPAIDAYTKIYLTLGERFLKIRHHPDPKKATHEALSNMGKEDEMRTELTYATARFLTALQINDELPPIPESYSLLIEDIAYTVAILRTPVPMNVWKFEMNNTAQPVTEYPTRLAKQLKKLACSLSIIRGKKEVTIEEIKTMKRVARDTCVPNRILIIEALMPKAGKEAESFTTRDIAHKIKIPLTSCWRELKEMEVLYLVEYTQTHRETGTYGNYLKHTPANDGWKLLNLELANILETTEIVAAKTIIEKETESGCFTNSPPHIY